jgi:hypothetical protein
MSLATDQFERVLSLQAALSIAENEIAALRAALAERDEALREVCEAAGKLELFHTTNKQVDCKECQFRAAIGVAQAVSGPRAEGLGKQCRWCDEGRPFMPGSEGKQHVPLYGEHEHGGMLCRKAGP